MPIKHFVRFLPIVLLFLLPNLSSAATEFVSVIRQSCTGYANCYTSLSAWEAARQGDLVAVDAIETARIEGDWTVPDTTAVTIDGWTTGPNNYINIYTDTTTTPSARHDGKWNTSKYRLEVTSGPVINILEEYTRIDGLQVFRNANAGTDNGIVSLNANNANSDIKISNNIIKGNGLGVGNYGSGIQGGFNMSAVVKIWNNIIYDINASTGYKTAGIYLNNARSGTSIFNNTIVNSATGIADNNLNIIIAKNNLIINATTPMSGTFAAGTNFNVTNSASMGYTVTGAGNINDKTSQVVSFVDSTNKDFHLISSDTSAKDSGTDLSFDTNLPFTTDIDGATRAGSWDIGADESTTVSSDTTAPSTPTGLSAITISSSQINLSWTASTDDTAVVGYKIYRDGTQVNTSVTTSYSDTGLTGSTTYTYTVSAYDAAPNNSTQSSSAQATTQAGADTTPPVRSAGSPSGALASSTTSTTLSLSTNENATCKYSTTVLTAYASMTGTFSTTGATTHSVTISGLTAGTSYNYYVRCQDGSNNTNTDDYAISFSVSSASTSTPSIFGATGTFTNGSPITLTGSNFGVKASATPVIWDNFEGGTNGGFLKDYSSWMPFAGNGAQYINTTPYSGALSSYANFIAGSNTTSQTNYKEFSKSDEAYVSYMFRYEYSGDNYGIMKLARITSDYVGSVVYTPNYNGPGDTTMTFQPQAAWLTGSYNSGNTANQVTLNTSTSNITANEWQRVEMYKKLSTPGQNDGIIDMARNNIKLWLDGAIQTRESGFAFKLNSFLLGLMFANAQNDANIKIYIDDVYVDTTRARLELCDSSSWGSKVKCEIQIPTAWSNTSITFTANHGTFTNGQNAYLYVIDSNGNVNTSGYPVVIGQSFTDTTAPVRSSGAPTGALAAGTTSTTLSLSTNENATCKYSTTANTAYASMTNTISATATTTHSVIVSGLTNGSTNNYYVRCQDGFNNANTDDYSISFSVDQPGVPAITTVSGMFTNNASIILSGSNFGTTNGSIVTWDDFESQITNDQIVGKSPIIGPTYATLITNNAGATFSTAKAHGGTKAAKIDWPLSGARIASFGWSNQGPYNQLYITYWRYMQTTEDPLLTSTNHKQYYLFGNDTSLGNEQPQGMPMIPMGNQEWGYYNKALD